MIFKLEANRNTNTLSSSNSCPVPNTPLPLKSQSGDDTSDQPAQKKQKTGNSVNVSTTIVVEEKKQETILVVVNMQLPKKLDSLAQSIETKMQLPLATSLQDVASHLSNIYPLQKDWIQKAIFYLSITQTQKKYKENEHKNKCLLLWMQL